MGGVWCDVLLVRYSINGTTQVCSAFYPVPFSSGGLTVQRVLDIEAELNKRSWGVRDVQVLGYDLLNEMLVEEDKVETVIGRPEMQVLMNLAGTETTEVETVSAPVIPTQERLNAIAGLFKDGFCDDRMAHEIYAVALGIEDAQMRDNRS
ncbi:hypothetical protein [Enterobacter phage EspM4VN]|uniref:DUF7425 domain-containing protein n=1 Tax=Enterobacter phage EspM4VN TaxID=2137745 RepID=A0A4V0P770_9CAUD|nr:hypothetical protein HYP11_gp147 [Enterobacter phage EspM4VN]BBK03807.1 hypothetical protein [Enterobacter phage EspM4VN]